MLLIDILLIDDDEDEFDILKDALTYLPYNVRCVYANTLDKALLLLSDLRPRFILVDMNMPAANGLSAVKKIRAAGYGENAQVIMYSTHVDDELANLAIQAGANGCMKKPPSVTELSQKLDALIIDEE
jgi:DNA-binding response OmpR family regulator